MELVLKCENMYNFSFCKFVNVPRVRAFRFSGLVEMLKYLLIT